MRKIPDHGLLQNLLGLKRIGLETNSTVGEASVIHLLRKKPSSSTKFPYLVLSDSRRDVYSKEVDLLELNTLDNGLLEMLKRCPTRKLGIELSISVLRSYEGQRLAKAITLIKALHKITEKGKNQLVLTSGACSLYELVSGRCFDALLELCDISPAAYWTGLNNWLDDKICMRCYDFDT